MKTVLYIRDVRSPDAQAGVVGQTRTLDDHAADVLLSAGYVIQGERVDDVDKRTNSKRRRSAGRDC